VLDLDNNKKEFNSRSPLSKTKKGKKDSIYANFRKNSKTHRVHITSSQRQLDDLEFPDFESSKVMSRNDQLSIYKSMHVHYTKKVTNDNKIIIVGHTESEMLNKCCTSHQKWQWPRPGHYEKKT